MKAVQSDLPLWPFLGHSCWRCCVELHSFSKVFLMFYPPSFISHTPSKMSKVTHNWYNLNVIYYNYCQTCIILHFIHHITRDIRELTSAIKYLPQTAATGFHYSITDLTGDLFVRA